MHDNRKSAGQLQSSSKSAVTVIDQSFAKEKIEPRYNPCKQLHRPIPQQWFAKFVCRSLNAQPLRHILCYVHHAPCQIETQGEESTCPECFNHVQTSVVDPLPSYLLNLKYRLQHPSSYYDHMIGILFYREGSPIV
jgi:hypothetical protein